MAAKKPKKKGQNQLANSMRKVQQKNARGTRKPAR